VCGQLAALLRVAPAIPPAATAAPLKARRPVPTLSATAPKLVHDESARAVARSHLRSLPMRSSITARLRRVAALAAIAVLGALGPQSLSAQSEASSSFTIGLNQDNFFGFYPTFAGTYTPRKERKVDLAF
jgi:hypothetical protein